MKKLKSNMQIKWASGDAQKIVLRNTKNKAMNLEGAKSDGCLLMRSKRA